MTAQRHRTVIAVVCALAVFVIVAGACASAAQTSVPPTESAEPTPLGRPGELLWRVKVGSIAGARPPAVVDGVVYFGSTNRNVYAIDAANGAVIWRYETEFHREGFPIFSIPTVIGGTVYIGSLDGVVYTFDAATGTPLWRYQADDLVVTTPALVDGVVYFGSKDYHLYALDAATGELRWRYNAGGPVYISPLVDEGVLSFASDDGYMHVLDASSGALRWRARAGKRSIVSLAMAGDEIYARSDDEYLRAFNSVTGELRWQYKMCGQAGRSLDIVDGIVYVANGANPHSYGDDILDHHVYALHATTGQLIWRHDSDYYPNSPLTVADGVVYYGSEDLRLYGLDAITGEQLWYYEYDPEYYDEWTNLAAGGGVVFIELGGYLYAVKALPAKSTRGTPAFPSPSPPPPCPPAVLAPAPPYPTPTQIRHTPTSMPTPGG